MNTSSLLKLSTLLVLPFIFIQGCASSGSRYSASESLMVVSSQQEDTELHTAALHGDINKVRQELNAGTSPNAIGSSGFTPMHWAATNAIGNHKEMIELMVQFGGDPNIPQSSANMVPLQFAHNAAAVHALVAAGANVHHKDIAQGTPLHNATKPDVAQALLEHGADRNAKNISGQTPEQKLQQTLPYFGSEPIYDAAKKQYRDTIAVLQNYQPGTKRVAPVTGGSVALAANDYNSESTTDSSHDSAANDEPEVDFEAAEKKAKELEDKQLCPMYDYDWFYTGKDCQDELAHGQGEAINPYENMKFEGEIKAGQPVEGTMYKNEEVLYEGKFREGVAHGSGICFYQGSPEECRYYKGERIDTLHKQREEFNRQQEMLSQRKHDEPEDDYDDYSEPETSYQAPRYNTSYESSYEQESSDPMMDAVGDAVQEELINQGTKMLIDQFF